MVIDKRNKDKSIPSLLKLAKKIRKNNYDLIFSPHRSLRTSLLVMGSGVGETYGFSNSSFKHVYKYLIKYEPKHHEVRRNLELIGFSKTDQDWKILPRIEINEEAAKKVDKFIAEKNLNSNIAAIAPGSVWNTKIYPEKYFSEIVIFLNKKGFHTIIIGGAGDKELCTDIFEKNRDFSTATAGTFSITETIGLLKKAKILISNDSAPAHMGLCANIPVLTLYCSTVPDFGFYPYTEKSAFLSYADLQCKPCGIHGYNECPVKTFACAYNLKPSTVISKIEEMLNDQH